MDSCLTKAIMQSITITFMAVLGFGLANAKIFTQEEVIRALRTQGEIPEEDIAKYVCIACHETRYNSSAIHKDDAFGLFQLSDDFWCGKGFKGGECEADCYDFTDDHLEDDVQCLTKVTPHNWPTYVEKCAQDPFLFRFGEECTFDEEEFTKDNRRMWCPTCATRLD
eukprot:TCALIF_07273-PA protein Name:"Similar to AGAP007347 Lysozyme c-1 (Anopheles gambiae)" AED:0.43 eAED:0.43 QI:85/1/1/1/1/1/4/43/166